MTLVLLPSRVGTRHEPFTACFLRSFETRSLGQKSTFSGETSATCRPPIHKVTTAWRGKLYWIKSHVRLPMCTAMPTHLPDPDIAARDYEKTLRTYFSKGWPRFDLVLLGLGEEGHTASLFPRSPALEETRRWVVAVKAPSEPPLRLTLTLPALTEAAHIYFLVAGSNKAQALHHVLAGSPDPNSYPASGIRRAGGTVIWWVDREAAALLREPAA
jgi:6-phosphogluconolactonase